MKRGFIDPEMVIVLAVFFIGIVLGGIAGHGVGWVQATESEQNKAIENGVGHWRMIEDGPEVEFVYEPKPD